MNCYKCKLLALRDFVSLLSGTAVVILIMVQHDKAGGIHGNQASGKLESAT
jgi:preprotein translocase subunit SecG